MAIELLVKKYCANCEEFDPKISKISFAGNGEILYDTVIKCKHHNRCRKIAECIRGEMMKEKALE